MSPFSLTSLVAIFPELLVILLLLQYYSVIVPVLLYPLELQYYYLPHHKHSCQPCRHYLLYPQASWLVLSGSPVLSRQELPPMRLQASSELSTLGVAVKIKVHS